MIGAVCFVKAGRSAKSPLTPSQLVAMEIDARMRDIAAAFGPRAAVIAYGDSFLPSDNGETFGTIGWGPDGTGGVLSLLSKTRGPDLIVMPWAYSTLDGETFPAPGIRVDRARQIRYLQRLGYRYIPGTGEDGGEPVYRPDVGRTKKCLYQWFRTSMEHPRGLAGWAHLTFEDFSRCEPGTGVCVDYTAPLLSYLAWSFSDPGSVFGHEDYSERFFSKVDFVRSIREMAWKEGEHFTRPESKPPTGREDAPWWKFWLR